MRVAKIILSAISLQYAAETLCFRARNYYN